MTPDRLSSGRFAREVLEAREHEIVVRRLVETGTREELYDEAAALGIPGRAAMSRDQLAEAIARHS